MHGLALPALLLATVAAAEPPPTLDRVDAERRGVSLGARVHATQLPGERIESSLASGLPGAIELRLRLQDEADRSVAENRVYLRVAFDLWEEVFEVEGPGARERFPDLAALRAYLEELPWLPVASFARIEAEERHRLRVDCRLHPVAPRETARLEGWVAGEPRRAPSGEGREVSVGLGELIRFFYRGSSREPEVDASRFSAWFVPDELPDEEEGR